MTLLIGTTNADKLREIRHLLAGSGFPVIGLSDLPLVAEPDETGATFAENACLKALFYDAHARSQFREPLLTVAEDSGLAIDALDGEPGIRSARFLRPDASYPERFAEIQRRLNDQPDRPRTARFVCALAAVRNGAVAYQTIGLVEGEISQAAAGSAGFGYDPIFYYPPYGCTLAQVSEERKLAVAHRGQAFRQLAGWLASQ